MNNENKELPTEAQERIIALADLIALHITHDVADQNRQEVMDLAKDLSDIYTNQESIIDQKDKEIANLHEEREIYFDSAIREAKELNNRIQELEAKLKDQNEFIQWIDEGDREDAYNWMDRLEYKLEKLKECETKGESNA